MKAMKAKKVPSALAIATYILFIHNGFGAPCDEEGGHEEGCRCDEDEEGGHEESKEGDESDEEEGDEEVHHRQGKDGKGDGVERQQGQDFWRFEERELEEKQHWQDRFQEDV